jgi:hypothetical protein
MSDHSDAHAALDSIRNQLQVILLHSELARNSGHCESCLRAVCHIVDEVRALEAFVSKILDK